MKVRNNFRIKHGEERRNKLVSLTRNSHTLFLFVVAFGSVVTYMIARSMREERMASALYAKIQQGVVIVNEEPQELKAQNHIFQKTIPAPVTNPNIPVTRAAIQRKQIVINYCKEQLFLLVVVFSEDMSTSLRDVIRDTWCKKQEFAGGRKVACAFAVGENGRTQKFRGLLAEESLRHRDIIHVPLIDDVRNSTAKLLNVFDHVTSKCKLPKYVLRTEDDVVINMEKMVENFLPSKPETTYAAGRCREEESPHRNIHSSFYVSYEDYPGNIFPPLCYSMGYLLSGDVMKSFSDPALRHHLIPLDDVFVGVALRRLKVVARDLDNFLYLKSVRATSLLPSDVMCNHVIVHVHVNAEEGLRRLWESMMPAECTGV